MRYTLPACCAMAARGAPMKASGPSSSASPASRRFIQGPVKARPCTARLLWRKVKRFCNFAQRFVFAIDALAQCSAFLDEHFFTGVFQELARRGTVGRLLEGTLDLGNILCRRALRYQDRTPEYRLFARNTKIAQT